MNSLYILIFTLLLYIFFATIVDVFIATDASTQFLRSKTKVFFHTFVAPIMFALTIFFVIFTDNKTINIVFGCGLILGSLIRIFATDRKYLTEFQIVNGYLNIYYMTPFTKLKERKFYLTNISDMEIEKANWLIDYPAVVSIKYEENWVKFEIIDKTLKKEVQKNINAANISIAKSVADVSQHQQQ